MNNQNQWNGNTCTRCGRTGSNEQWRSDHTGHCNGNRNWREQQRRARRACRGRRSC
mgnify:CR=1 FL=1